MRSTDQTLLHYSQLSSILNQPRKYDVGNIAANLDDANLPDYLLGLDSSTWKDKSLRYDLASVNSIHEFDIVTKCLIRLFLRPYHLLSGHRKVDHQNGDANMYHYDDAFLEIPAHVISTIFASLLPVVAIVVLNSVKSMPKRLGLIGLFTAVFSASISGFTKTRRLEVFAATST
jgi:hypothetical protein